MSKVIRILMLLLLLTSAQALSHSVSVAAQTRLVDVVDWTVPVGERQIGIVGPRSTGAWHMVRGSQERKLASGAPVFEGWGFKRDSPSGMLFLELSNSIEATCPGPFVESGVTKPYLNEGETLSLSKFEKPEDPWWAKFLGTVAGEITTWVSPSSRDLKQEAFLTDSIIELQNSLDLRDVFSGIEDGEYRGQFTVFSGDQERSRDSGIDAKIKKSGNSVVAECARPLAPGLYKFNLTVIISKSQPKWTPESVKSVLVYVADPQVFKQKNALFKKAVEKTESIGSRSPGTRRADLLRAYVFVLASPKSDHAPFQ